MKNIWSKIPSQIKYLLSVFVLLMLLFSAFRYILYQNKFSTEISPNYYQNALSLGLSYDFMVVAYLLVLPSIAFIACILFNRNTFFIRKAITVYFSIVFIISLLACCADIPCYHFTGTRLNNSLLLWTDTPGAMLGFVFGNSAFRNYLILFFIGTILSIWILIRLEKKFLQETENHSSSKKIASVIFILLFVFTGIRGGLRLRPIAVRDAFVTNYPFVNMLPLNPLFSFFDSMSKINMDYVDEQTAIKNTRAFLNIKENLASPIARKIVYGDSAIKPNILLILMESMSAEMTHLSSSGKSFTPNLDSIAKKGISFSKFYTSGMHTCNGLYGVLYSMPSVPGMHPLSNVHTANQNFYGMPSVLKENGYSTNFFCTHFEEFDNMGFFLRNNGFDNFFSAKEYESNLSEGMFGVSDETQYGFALNKFNELGNSGKPFFSAMLTISTHEPPTLPKKTSFKPKSKTAFEQVYEYADWALGNFMNKCSKEKWFDNTIFIFVADHGCNMPNSYELPLSYHHSPFIIYAPSIIKDPQEINKLALQEDIFPTLMDLLKMNYTNTTLGINLFSEKRPFAFFCKDYLVGCLNEKHFLIIRKFGGESLHDYPNNNPENTIEQHRSLADSMKTYTYSMLETAQWLLINKKLGKQ